MMAPFLLAALTAAAAAHAMQGRDPAAVEKAAPVPGEKTASVFGEKGYIEYLPGNAPIIITAPHGGRLMPDSIPTRSADACGGTATVVTDRNTMELAKQIRESFFKRYGTYPHVIVSHLARRKLDANRPIGEATCGSDEAAQAFREWHGFIDQAKAAALRDYGKGWFMDIHGHAHDIPRVEIGYLLKAESLALPDRAINADATLRDRSSIRSVGARRSTPLAELLRGPHSLGSMFERSGFPAVPSGKAPDPQGAKYFSAGYNTLRHGCSVQAQAAGGDPDGNICAVQLETNYKGLRDTAENRERFGDVAAVAVGEFLNRYFALNLAAKSKPVRR